MDKAYYLSAVAPVELERITEYRPANQTYLDAKQHGFLDQLEGIVKNLDTAKVAEMENNRTTVFTAQQCRSVLHGPRLTAHRSQGSVGSAELPVQRCE